MHYTAKNGVGALFGGTVPLALREGAYVTSITIVNPIVTEYFVGRSSGEGSSSHWKGIASAFSVGMATGLITAPLQTVSAMMKFDKNRGQTAMDLIRKMYKPGVLQGTNRIFFGAGTRSVRIGGAGILYFEARTWMKELAGLSGEAEADY